MLSLQIPLIHPLHLNLLYALLSASLIQRLMNRNDTESQGIFKNNLVYISLCFSLSLLGQVFQNTAIYETGKLLQDCATLGLGLLLIRICGLILLQALISLFQLRMPRIVQELLLMIAYLVWTLLWLRLAGLNLSALVTTSAVITAIAAFSMQETLGNILGGLALQIDNSVRIGDWIRLDEIRGQVIDVRWRHTAVRSNNGNLIVIPNSVLMKSKVDIYSRSSAPDLRRWVHFRVNDNVAPQLVIETVETALRQTRIDHISSSKPIDCIVTDLRDGSIDYALRYWLNNPAHDDGTDSSVRIHFYSALKRQNLFLAHPCMDLELTTSSGQQSLNQQQAELESRLLALSKVKLLAGLNAEEMLWLAKTLRETPFIKGDLITRQGAVAHWLYLLVSGEADIWHEPQDQERHHLGTLKEGEVFGEIGLLTGAPRAATVTAKTNTLCYRLDKDHFESILHTRPELAVQLAQSLSLRKDTLELLRNESNTPAHLEPASYLKSIRHFLVYSDAILFHKSIFCKNLPEFQ